MKNTTKLFGIIAIVAIGLFSFIACDNGNGDGDNSTLNGTWVNSSDGISIVLNNGNFTISMDNIESLRGTYNTNGNNMTMNTTRINGAMFGEAGPMMGLSQNQWYTVQEYMTVVINTLIGIGMTQAQAEAMLNEIVGGKLFETQTGTYTLSGNTLILTMNGEVIVLTMQ